MIVKYKNKEIQVQAGEKVMDILKTEIENSEKLITACNCNNEIKALNYDIKEDTNIELVDYTSMEGKRVYIRGLIYIMAMAFNQVYPEIKITVNYQLHDAMYCDIADQKVTVEMLENVRNKMNEIIQKNLPIMKIQMSPEEAEKFFKEKNIVNGKLQFEVKGKKDISLYKCEDYYNYFYGVMPISTGIVKIFDIVKYHDGFLVRYPSRTNANALTNFVETKKLASTLLEYSDIHRVLGVDTIGKLNSKVRDGSITDYILLDEALHEKKIAEIADNVANKKEVKMILIAGPSSSGKTTFARKLGMQLRLNGLKPVTISVDNYFVEREQNPRDELGNYDFECIEALDLELFNNHITKLLNGEEIDVPRFDFTEGKKHYDGTKMKLADDEVLVIEGIHCLNDRLTASIPRNRKYKIYISALTVLNIDSYNRISTTDTRLIRRIVRDNQYRNYSALHTLKIWYSVNRGEEKNIFPYQEEADSMFNSSLIYELGVLKDYALPLLKEINNTNPEYAEAKRIATLLSYFESIPEKNIPNTSLIREFIGNGVYDVH
jgi:uridine kinase